MSGGANNPLSKVVGRIFPKVPDFVGMIAEQSALAVEATSALVSFMESGSQEAALRVRELEHQGDTIKDRNVDELNQAFSTPMDREDLYRAMISIDEVLNYCKTTVREMEVLGVVPDPYTLEMAQHLKDGAESLNQGYQTFSAAPAGAEGFAQAAKKAERNTEVVGFLRGCTRWRGTEHEGNERHEHRTGFQNRLCHSSPPESP